MTKRKSGGKVIRYKHMQKTLKKTKPPKMFVGLEKVFTEKPKRSSKAHKAKGSTWLKKPPAHASKRASGDMR